MSHFALSLVLILFTVSSNAAAQIMLKRGMMQLGALDQLGSNYIAIIFGTVFQPWIFAGFCTFVVSMASHLVVLSRVELSFAYPFLSIAYVIVGVYAYLVFGEDIGLLRVAGFGLICAGTVLISLS